MQRLVRHRRPMLAVILAALVALSSTLMMLITMGQQEETPVQQEKKLQDDNQLIARTNAKGKAHFGLGILNPIEHKILPVFNSEDNATNATFTTAAATGIANSKANATLTTAPAPATSIVNDSENNNNNNNNNNANGKANTNSLNMGTSGENIKNNDVPVDTNPNIFVNPKDNPTTVASCGQVITRDVILLKDIECPGVGMIVGTDGITINLNNHRLSLANNTDTSRIPEIEEIGILVPGQKNITIRGPGVIMGFDKAIEFEGSVVMDSNYFIIGANSLIGNGNNGIFLDVSSFNNTISSNNILNHVVDISNADGIPIHISMNEYFENRCGKALPD